LIFQMPDGYTKAFGEGMTAFVLDPPFQRQAKNNPYDINHKPMKHHAWADGYIWLWDASQQRVYPPIRGAKP
jgi:hypothetical protein